MRLDPQFLPIGDDFPEPHMSRAPIIPPAAQRTWADMWPLDRDAMIQRMLASSDISAYALGLALDGASQSHARALAAAFPELVQKYGPQWGKQ